MDFRLDDFKMFTNMLCYDDVDDYDILDCKMLYSKYTRGYKFLII